MTHQYPTNPQYPTNYPYAHPSLPPQKTGMSGVAVSLIAIGALAAGCIGGVTVGNATGTTTASGPRETITARATVTVTATETVTMAPETEVAKRTATEPTQAGTIQEGTWAVGEDIAPGTYKTAEAVVSSCYWKITRSGTNGSDIVENDIVRGGYPRVTLQKGQDFETQDCGTWIKVG